MITPLIRGFSVSPKRYEGIQSYEASNFRPPMVGVFSWRSTMAEANGYLALLRRTLRRLEVAVFDEGTPPRDLASLTRRLLAVSREIERL